MAHPTPNVNYAMEGSGRRLGHGNTSLGRAALPG